MKTLDSIPVGKIHRASKLLQTGVRVGGNYLKYYGEKLINPDLDRSQLDQDNAGDIYDSLKELKGSALKVAQMLSMEKNLLPRAYVEKFSLAQFSVPPLSAPLVRKTFRTYLNASPEDLFDAFEADASFAATIGQVHRAQLNGKNLAVKIQYPGVAESIRSDLAIVRPIALRMFNLQGKQSDIYFKEVEEKLLEETNYELELQRSQIISEACRSIPDLDFPKYYPELSCQRILTMDWMDGMHLSNFVARGFEPVEGSRLGQTLWDFYMFQIHGLRQVHADPHPGNFLVSEHGHLVVLDFGCVKDIPETFYVPYFELADNRIFEQSRLFEDKLMELEILRPEDSASDRKYLKTLFREMLELFTLPFNASTFNFGDPQFWERICSLGKKYADDQSLRRMNGNRGSRHFLYMNRTFFGLYNLLYDLNAQVNVHSYQTYLPVSSKKLSV